MPPLPSLPKLVRSLQADGGVVLLGVGAGGDSCSRGLVGDSEKPKETAPRMASLSYRVCCFPHPLAQPRPWSVACSCTALGAQPAWKPHGAMPLGIKTATNFSSTTWNPRLWHGMSLCPLAPCHTISATSCQVVSMSWR